MWVSTDCLSGSPPLPHISPYRGHKTVTQFFGRNGNNWYKNQKKEALNHTIILETKKRDHIMQSLSFCCFVFSQLGQQPFANRLGQMTCIPVTTSARKV